MSHVLTATPPGTALRRFAARTWSDPESRSVLVGLLAVLLVHLVLFLVAPFLLRTDPIKASARKQAIPRQFNIEIAPDAFSIPVRPPPPVKYVEANPNAPDKVPENTNNFSSKNQVLAQEKPPAEKHNDAPRMDGKKIESNQTVSGQLTKQEDVAPVPDTTKASAKTVKAARQEQDPLAGFDKMKEGDDGYGSNLGKVPTAKAMPDKVEGSKASPVVDGATSDMPDIDPRRPRARPVLKQVHTRPAIFQDNQFGTSNIGPVAFSAKWSAYGEYLHKMMEAIQIQWDRILIDSHTQPPSGSYVTIKFTLDSKGRIIDIADVENTSSEQGKQSCLSAITITAPYGEWSEDMIAVLGNSQELTFQFYYE